MKSSVWKVFKEYVSWVGSLVSELEGHFGSTSISAGVLKSNCYDLELGDRAIMHGDKSVRRNGTRHAGRARFNARESAFAGEIRCACMSMHAGWDSDGEGQHVRFLPHSSRGQNASEMILSS